MKQSYREVIHKFPFLYEICKYLMFNTGKIRYSMLSKKYGYKNAIRELKGKKSGQTCFIIGNGPSLLASDLEKLKHIDTFASNSIYRIFVETDWRPTYYLIQDRYFEIPKEELDIMNVKNIFLGDYYCRFNQVGREDRIEFKMKYYFNKYNKVVGEDLDKFLPCSSTVSFMAMQIASYMGYSNIYLLGFDHTYKFLVNEKGEIIETDAPTSHFTADLSTRKHYENQIEMNAAYTTFKEFAMKKNITIKNATRGGELEIFDRIDFDALVDSLR